MSIEPTFATVTNGDVRLRVAVTGNGPLVVCVHGWPELWYSWRHQMEYLAGLGYTVAALDVRGYGGSSAPDAVAAYTLTELCADVAAVITHFDLGPAILLGHDWGSPIAWNTARLHAPLVRAVVGLSVPYFPVGPESSIDRWQRLFGDQGKFFYQLYFQEQGVAEAELEADSLRSIRMIYYAAAGESRGELFVADKPASSTLLDGLIDPDPFPDWASPDDLQVYADAMRSTGWRGPLNRYRAQGLDAEQIGKLESPNITQPATFIGGEHDVVRKSSADIDPYDFAHVFCDDFRGTTVIPNVGHWVQQEAANATNRAIKAFLDTLSAV